MTAISIKNFDKSFIDRTIILLSRYNNYSDEYEFTLLLNSLLALIVVPREITDRKERKLKFDFLNQKLSKFTVLTDIFAKEKETIEGENKDGKTEIVRKFFFTSDRNKDGLKLSEVTLMEFLDRLRHGIAHIRMRPYNESGKWSGIIISNKNKKGQINFEIFLSYNELLKLSKFIAGKYTDNICLS